MMISVVTPVYKAENIVPELVRQISETLQTVTSDFEIILVEDCGPDNSWQAIQDECRKFNYVKGVKLSRNFGQHYAISAGVAKAKGDNVVLMDCDLQDNPKDIIRLLQERDKGYDIVFTKRLSRKHNIFKSVSSRIYNGLFRFFSDGNYDVNMGSLVLFSKRVAEQFNRLQEKDRLYIQLLKWLGFKTTSITVEHQERYEGKSSYNFLKLLKLGLQGWTSHSDKLLKMSIYLGFLLSFLAFGFALTIIIRYFLYDLMPGWPSIIVTILFSTGLILLSIGVMGLYIGKIFEQSKNRPLYVIEEEININETADNT